MVGGQFVCSSTRHEKPSGINMILGKVIQSYLIWCHSLALLYYIKQIPLILSYKCITAKSWIAARPHGRLMLLMLISTNPYSVYTLFKLSPFAELAVCTTLMTFSSFSLALRIENFGIAQKYCYTLSEFLAEEAICNSDWSVHNIWVFLQRAQDCLKKFILILAKSEFDILRVDNAKLT